MPTVKQVTHTGGLPALEDSCAGLSPSVEEQATAQRLRGSYQGLLSSIPDPQTETILLVPQPSKVELTEPIVQDAGHP